MTITAPPYTSSWPAATNSPQSSRKEHGERREVPDQRERRVEGVAEADDGERAGEAGEGCPEPHDPDEEVRHYECVFLVVRDGRVVEVAVGDRHPLDRLGEQHVLRVDEVVAVVLGDLEVVAERDRVERAGELAVAAEDAARHVDLVDARVPLAGRDAVVGRVLGRPRRGCSRPGTRPRRASSRRTSRARSRAGAAGGGRGSAGTPAACTPGTAA